VKVIEKMKAKREAKALAERKAKARTWEIPTKDHLKVLRDIANKKGPVEVYEFWEDIAKVLPETKGVECRVDFRGAIPYIREVVK
jgi:hypothetical protein